MKSAPSQTGKEATSAPLIGDHLAMHLLNTEAHSDGDVVDHWASDEDVLRWLHQTDAVPPSPDTRIAPAGLLRRARTLRARARELIVMRKQGEQGSVDGLNDYLRAHVTAPTLDRDGEGNLVLNRVARGDATASLLGPVAEAVAHLLVEGDFARVKQCEHPDCILWFHDRTKSHRRRWCSMALCGNRHKAAQFRKRRSGAQR